MELGYCGISYKKAALEIRDKIAFTDSRKLQMFKSLESIGVSQAVILATCNRSEVYFMYDSPQKPDMVRKIYKDMFNEVSLEQFITEETGEAAAKYLFRVAAGMESQVLGEDQILGQVKDAYDFSKAMGYSGKELNQIIRDAVTCAKKIKTELKISEIPLSVSYVGIKQLERDFGIAGKNVLVIGSGQTSALALKYVKEYGAKKVYVCNRTTSHARELKKEFEDIDIVDYEDRYEIMKECSIVISATASPHTVISADKCNITGQMYFLDLASPRDIEMSVGNNPDCTLVNLDMLEIIVNDNQKKREELISRSEVIIDEAVGDTIKRMLTSGVDDTIKSLQAKCREIANDSFEYLERKLDLSDKDKEVVKRTLNASFKRLLKEPILELKRLETKEEQDKYKDTLEKLFQI